MTEKQLTSQIKAGEVAAKLRSRAPLIVVVTPEEARVEPYLYEAARAAGMDCEFYDVAQGFTDINKTVLRDRGQGDLDEALATIKERSSSKDEVPRRTAWVMRDLTPWIKEPVGLLTARNLRNLINWLPEQPLDRAQAIIMITAKADLPPEIATDAQIIEWPMPDRDEMGAILDAACAPVLNNTAVRDDGSPAMSEDIKAAVRDSITGDNRSEAIDAAIGLSGSEAQSCFATSLVMLRRIDPPTIAQEKKRVVAKERLIEWFDPPAGGFDNVGAFENFKAWVRQRKVAYTPAARAYGLTAPKGVLLVGVSGCGKSLSVKCTGGEWRVPVIKLDLGALKSKFVGESEQNLRKALQMIEALGWCVVWLDEIEKALAGSTGEQGDGGVSADALGAILTWMQDRRGEAFVMATANDAAKLPPELLRKGRFDEVWWVDLPTRTERTQIVRAALRQRGLDADVMADMDLDAVAAVTDTFTGAEIDALVPDAMFVGFGDGAREITTQDLINAAKDVVPLAETKKEQIDELRKTWSKRARPVSKPDAEVAEVTTRAGSRQIDII
jgi:hypothetical protein